MCSRRAADEHIASGKVRVNGAIATVGMRVDPAVDTIEVEGATVARLESERVVIMLNKPRGYVTSSEQRTKDPIVLDLVRDVPVRVFPVGRLDKESRGLLLLTNDGLLAYRLTHPRFAKEKEYLVRVAGIVTSEHVEKLRAGVRILGALVKPASVRQLAKGVLQIVLTEGKNRQIRRMLRTLNLVVTDLQRVRVGALRLESLGEGKWRFLTLAEVAALREIEERPRTGKVQGREEEGGNARATR